MKLLCYCSRLKEYHIGPFMHNFTVLRQAYCLHKETKEAFCNEQHNRRIGGMISPAKTASFEPLVLQEDVRDDPHFVRAMKGYWKDVKCWVAVIHLLDSPTTRESSI